MPDVYEFYNLGIEGPYPVSASSMLGLGDMMDEVVKYFPEGSENQPEDERPKVAIIGKPNVGKSSLINKLAQEDRVIVSDIAGTTRDAIDTDIKYNGKEYVFIDTAGLRRKNKIKEEIERYSIIRAVTAVERADVVIIVIDATEGVTEQDAKIAGIAHDVRTPLTSAKGYAQGLRDGIAATPEKQKKYIDRICSSIDDTEKILNELLEISRNELKSYKLNRVNVNLKEFIDAGAEEIKELLERSNFDFSLQCNVNKDTQISVDTDAFARVFRNIVMNSIKYARDDRPGMVRLIVSEYERTVIIELTDNGSGVESENLTKIFDTMYRTDPARTKVSQGSGLGLAVCKQIVELHGGLIWASSKQGEGLSIFISMPKIKERTDKI